MNKFKFLKFFVFFILMNTFVFAENYNEEQSYENENVESDYEMCCKCKHRSKTCNLGVADFFTVDEAEWYNIVTYPYPNAVLLTFNRSEGFTQGNIALTPNGVQINEPGTYWVQFTANVTNTDNVTRNLLFFLVRGEVFNPADTSVPSTVGLIPFLSTSVQGARILENVTAGTKISVFAANDGIGPDPQTVTVTGWGIRAYKICESENTFRNPFKPL